MKRCWRHFPVDLRCSWCTWLPFPSPELESTRQGLSEQPLSSMRASHGMTTYDLLFYFTSYIRIYINCNQLTLIYFDDENLQGLTEKFKEKDTGYSGSATFTYESFMLTVLPFLIA